MLTTTLPTFTRGRYYHINHAETKADPGLNLRSLLRPSKEREVALQLPEVCRDTVPWNLVLSPATPATSANLLSASQGN